MPCGPRARLTAYVAYQSLTFAERDVLLADLRVGRQSLEDVFLRLTAREEGDIGSIVEESRRSGSVAAGSGGIGRGR